MTEYLQTYDHKFEKIEPTKFTLFDLVLATINGTIHDPYALFQIASDNLEQIWGGGKVLVASHKNATGGGYGLHTVALSIPEENGVMLIKRDGAKVIVLSNRNQTPLRSQRDSIHFSGVDLFSEYFFIHPQTVQEFLDQLLSVAKFSESEEALFPNAGRGE